MSNDFTFHMVLGKRITIHARYLAGRGDNEVVNFDSDEWANGVRVQQDGVKEYIARCIIPKIVEVAFLSESPEVRKAGRSLLWKMQYPEYGANEVFTHLGDFMISLSENREQLECGY